MLHEKPWQGSTLGRSGVNVDGQAYGLDSTSKACFRIRFSSPRIPIWLTAAPKTRWKWIGRGELRFEGNDSVLRGRRYRTLLPSASQEIRFPSSDVFDVVTTNATVSCMVKQEYGNAEPLMLWAQSAEEAQSIASHWPTVKSVAFQEQQAFRQALLSINARVVAVPALIGINVLVFIVMVSMGVNFLRPSGIELIPWGSDFGPLTLNGQWWRLLSSMFLHLGLQHLLFNMGALAVFGPLVERIFGTSRFLCVYFLAGLCGNIASLLWNPMLNSAGASGAILGVLGGLLAFVINPKTMLPASVSTVQRNVAIVFVAYNLVIGLADSGVDNACHIGGLVGGFAMGWMLARPLEPEARQHEWQGLLIGCCGGVAALAVLSWPLVHPDPEQLKRRQFGSTLIPFARDEARATTLAAKLDRLRRRGSITEQQWADRQLNEVLPLWQAADDDLFALQVQDDSQAYRARDALIAYLNVRRLAVELTAEAVRDHDAAKAAWAQRVTRSSEAKARIASKLLDSATR